MVEDRQTILERVARFAMELVGAEEVEKGIEEVDVKFRQMASGMQSNIKIMNELSAAFRTIGQTMSGTVLQQLPQTTQFLTQYAIAGEKAEVAGNELSLSMYAQSAEGVKLATSLGLITPKVTEVKAAVGGLKDAFWDLNSIARAVLRVFVMFKVLTGVFGIFRDMAQRSAELQAELWRLKATVVGVSDDLTGGMGAWEDWIRMVERLRESLPYISMVEVAEGLRIITALAGPLGLTAGQIEILTKLIGDMSVVVGTDFVPFATQMINALTGSGRAVASLNLDLRDGSKGLTDYAEAAGFVWDELNQVQRTYVRMAYAVSEMTQRSEEVAKAEGEEWLQLREVQKAREDILAQSPELIRLQIIWAEVLLEIAKRIERITEALSKSEEWIDAAEKIAFAFRMVYEALTGGELVTFEWERTLKWLDRLKEPWQEIGEEAKEAGKDIDEFIQSLFGAAVAAEDSGDALEEFGDRMARALQQARNALRSYQSAVEDAGINLARRLADIARNLEERLADLESRFEARRDQLIRGFEERRAEIKEDAAEREEELRRDLNKRLRRMEEDHQNEMRELREDYLLDLEEAARKLDAVSMRRIQQRYILEKKQRERDYDIDRRRAIEDYRDQLDELRKAREEQERELEESLERQLRELQENYERQQEEARLNAERQREDAIRNYGEQLDDLWRNFQDRLEAIMINLQDEEEEYKGTYGDLRTFFDEWYRDDLEKMWLWLEDRRRLLENAGAIEPRPPIIRPPWRPGPRMAQGGIGIARATTQVTVGESGPEIFAAWPLGQRMPRLGADIRLTIDGTQTGGWSVSFENQVIRILREVLEEAL